MDFRRVRVAASGRRHRLARGGLFFRLGEDDAAPSTMGLYSKGTRSKGVTKTFQKQGQANTVQRSKHEKRDAFLAKEAFMKEAMAKHLAAKAHAAAAKVWSPRSSRRTAARPADRRAVCGSPAASWWSAATRSQKAPKRRYDARNRSRLMLLVGSIIMYRLAIANI